MSQTITLQKSIQITNEDNMELMSRYQDNHFDLAIVDPPYGIGLVKTENGNWGLRSENKGNIDQQTTWDFNRPKKEYWDALFRVSKNQIVWGGNYFTNFLPPSKGWVFWDKKTGTSYFSDGELAFTSFDKGLRIIRKVTDRKERIHICQKPVFVYQWLLTNYAKKGDKILDTHIGSGSIVIALDSVNKVEKMDLTLVGCEIDPEYYEKTMQRINDKTKWQSLF